MDDQTLSEEIVNSITHGIAVGLSIAALVILVVFSSIYGNVWHIVSFTIFGATLVILYLASTLYHSITNVRAKKILRYLDYSAIFVLIAGTYTPYALVALNGLVGWVLFGVVWGLALVGIVFQKYFNNVFRVVLYLVMGWICIIPFKMIVDALSLQSLVFLVIGGLAYTSGVGFYVIRIRFFHSIFHLFVMAGSVMHFFSVLLIL